MNNILVVILLACASFGTFANDRDEMTYELLVQTGVIDEIKTVLKEYKSETVRLYPKITESTIENEYKEEFDNLYNQLLGAYALAYSNISEEDFTKLYKFYQTKAGKWLLKVEKPFSQDVHKYSALVTSSFNDEFVKKYLKLSETP